jgi:hypothetical protein
VAAAGMKMMRCVNVRDRCNQRILCGVVSHFFLAEARVSSILASAFFFFLQSKHKELLL